jgi:hypothetical protein
LHTTLKGLAECEVPKSEDFQVSTVETSSARTGKFQLQRLRILGCNNHLNDIITVSAQFLNLTSLGFSNVVKTRLKPLRNLKHLEKQIIKKSKFICATDLLTFMGNQLNCLNVFGVSLTDYNFISVNCQSLSCLRLCFEEVEELGLSCEYRQGVKFTSPLPEFPSVGSLQIFLSDSHAIHYIVTGCNNLRILNIKSRFPYIRIFVDGIIEPKNLIKVL